MPKPVAFAVIMLFFPQHPYNVIIEVLTIPYHDMTYDMIINMVFLSFSFCICMHISPSFFLLSYVLSQVDQTIHQHTFPIYQVLVSQTFTCHMGIIQYDSYTACLYGTAEVNRHCFSEDAIQKTKSFR